MQDTQKPRNTVFLLGYPRSGTTWISNLINAHPDVIYRHELFGRCYPLFGENLFSALKYENGVGDSDYAQALRVATMAHPEADRPPFFPKSYICRGLGWARKPAWLAAKTSRLLGGAYARVFEPRSLEKASLVVKETRSSVNLDSLVKGLRADKIVVLVRHPYSVIASHLSGRSAGVMAEDGPERRAEWFSNYRDAHYIKSNGISPDDIQKMPYVEYLSINWLMQNMDYLKMVKNEDAMLFAYENFLEYPDKETRQLYEFINLEVSAQVEKFLKESTSDSEVSVFKRDASNEFYSVFRGKSFDPKKWKKALSPGDTDLIDKHSKAFVAELGLFDLSNYTA